MSIVREFWDFMKVRKKFWLAPILIVLVILSAFIILAASSPVAAPFIYTLF
jgi:competence protein ComGC